MQFIFLFTSLSVRVKGDFVQHCRLGAALSINSVNGQLKGDSRLQVGQHKEGLLRGDVEPEAAADGHQLQGEMLREAAIKTSSASHLHRRARLVEKGAVAHREWLSSSHHLEKHTRICCFSCGKISKNVEKYSAS
jgi:hypothetical protein